MTPDACNRERDMGHDEPSRLTNLKPRFRWTRELHELFVEAVNQLGGAKEATPKRIKYLMDVQDVNLNRIKSHLQKYRMSTDTWKPANKISTSNKENKGNKTFQLCLNENAQVSPTENMEIEMQRRFKTNTNLKNLPTEKAKSTRYQLQLPRKDMEIAASKGIYMERTTPYPYQSLNTVVSSLNCLTVPNETEYIYMHNHLDNIIQPSPIIGERRMGTHEHRYSSQQEDFTFTFSIGLPDELIKGEADHQSRKCHTALLANRKQADDDATHDILKLDREYYDPTSSPKNIDLNLNLNLKENEFDLNIVASDEELRKY